MATTNSEIVQLVGSQSDKVTTINQAFEQLDDLIGSTTSIAVSGDFLLTDAQQNNAVRFNLTDDTPSGAVTMALQARPKLFILTNNCGQTVTVEVDPDADGADGTTVDVEDGDTVLLYSDGTNVISISSAGGGAAAFTDLTDTPGSLGSAGQVVAVNSGATALEFASGAYNLTENAQTGTTYTAVLADAEDVLVSMNNVSANTLTVPPNSTTAFPVGSVLNVLQKGAGQTTVAAGAGVTINFPASASLRLRQQNSVATLIKTATDTWYIIGDLDPAAAGALDADQVAYDNTTSLLTATNVQAAIDEIDAGLGTAAATVYETGTFTPVLTCVTPGDLSVSYSVQSGGYTKIGDTLVSTVRLVCTPTFTTASGQLRITGMPFTAAGVPGYVTLGNVEKLAFTRAQPFVQSAAAQTFLSFRSGDPTGVNNIALENISICTSGVAIDLRFTIVYYVT